MTGRVTADPGDEAPPRVVEELLEEWQLRRDGQPGTTGPDGRGSVRASVLPVRTSSGAPAALKVGVAPVQDPEAAQEHLALRHWDGRGAVRLLRADPRRHALLLERLHPEDLGDLWDLEACEVLAGLYARLHVRAPASLPTLAERLEPRVEALTALPRSAPLPRRLVEQAVALARDLLGDPQAAGTLVHGDLHFATVLAGDREPWLAGDPLPSSGDPHFEPAPALWTRFEELVEAPSGLSLRDGLRQRFHALVDGAGLDEDRARDWVVVRALDRACRRLEDPAGTQRTTPTSTYLTTCIAIAKAVQD